MSSLFSIEALENIRDKISLNCFNTNEIYSTCGEISNAHNLILKSAIKQDVEPEVHDENFYDIKKIYVIKK